MINIGAIIGLAIPAGVIGAMFENEQRRFTVVFMTAWVALVILFAIAPGVFSWGE